MDRSTVSGKSYLREFGNSKYHVNELRKFLDPDHAEWDSDDERQEYEDRMLRPGKFNDTIEKLKMLRVERLKKEFNEDPIFHDELNDIKQKLLRQKYFRDIEQLKNEFAKRISVTRTQRQSAQRCLDLIRKYDKKVLRFENLGIALSNLGRPDSFAGKESMVSDRFPLSYPENNSPASTRTRIKYDVDMLTGGFGHHRKYTSVVFFQQVAFDPEHQYGHNNWGVIKDLGINTMLGIQVLHWDPKVVYQTAKAMLKIRPKDPVVIFDLYGNVFFP